MKRCRNHTLSFARKLDKIDIMSWEIKIHQKASKPKSGLTLQPYTQKKLKEQHQTTLQTRHTTKGTDKLTT
jgi:hypothetical protein